MAEAKETPAPKVEKVSAAPALVSVKNITDRNVCLASGVVAPGETGKATLAEAAMLFEYLTPVK